MEQADYTRLVAESEVNSGTGSGVDDGPDRNDRVESHGHLRAPGAGIQYCAVDPSDLHFALKRLGVQS